MELKIVASLTPCAICDSRNCSCSRRATTVRIVAIVGAALVIVGLLVWQGIASQGASDPTTEGISRPAAIMNTRILVFREGLEAILVLAALTTSLVRTEQGYWKPVAIGAGFSFLASIATWFAVVTILSGINATALYVQAATGLLAIVVLLVMVGEQALEMQQAGWLSETRFNVNMPE